MRTSGKRASWSSDPVRQAIVAACKHFMEPVARFLMRNGVTFKEFAEVAKLAFVEVATNEYGLRNRPTNVSRTAVLTGLTRKEVKRIRDEIVSGGDPELRELGRPAQLLSIWFSNPQFLGDDGCPRELTLDGERGFRELCRLGGGDVPPGALLTELKRANCVEELPSGKIRALKRYFSPAGIDEFQATRFGECLHDLADSVEFNLSASRDKDRRFESRVWNDKIPRQFVNRFHLLVREQGETLLEMLDDWLTAHEDGTHSESEYANRKCGVGIYFFDSGEVD